MTKEITSHEEVALEDTQPTKKELPNNNLAHQKRFLNTKILNPLRARKLPKIKNSIKESRKTTEVVAREEAAINVEAAAVARTKMPKLMIGSYRVKTAKAVVVIVVTVEAVAEHLSEKTRMKPKQSNVQAMAAITKQRKMILQDLLLMKILSKSLHPTALQAGLLPADSLHDGVEAELIAV